MRNYLFLFASLLFAPSLVAEDVYLDFVTDDHDGSGGASNGTADWIDELNQATAAAGVTDFTPAERATIESNIQTHLETMFADYEVVFSTSVPGTTPFDTIDFGEPPPAGGVLGFAPFDVGNLFSDQETNVCPESFDFFIESAEPRATQITEISLGLAGTAGHELGHSIGLAHHHAYSNEGITPANYAATGGLQNEHIIATGSTGLTETGRETLRDLSPYSKRLMDITGGAALVFGGQDNESLVIGGIVSDTDENDSTDAGATIGTAIDMETLFAKGPTSLRKMVFIEADMDAAADVDVYRFETASSDATLLAHLFSDGLLYGAAGEFDTVLELLDSGGSVLATNDDVMYTGDTYDAGTTRTSDSFLNNVALTTAGTYYLRVTSFGGGGLLGENYWLVASVDGQVVPVELMQFGID